MPPYWKADQLKRPRRAKAKDGYAEATERARTKEGWLVCESCGRSMLDGTEQRHHIRHRSLGGR